MAEGVRVFLQKMGAVRCKQPHTSLAPMGAWGFHRYMAAAISAFVASDWDEHIDSVLFAYRTTAMDGFRSMNGRPATLPIDRILRKEHLEPPAEIRRRAPEEGSKQGAPYVPSIKENRLRRFHRNKEMAGDVKKMVYNEGIKFTSTTRRLDSDPLEVTKFSKVNDGLHSFGECLHRHCVQSPALEDQRLSLSITRMIPADSRAVAVGHGQVASPLGLFTWKACRRSARDERRPRCIAFGRCRGSTGGE